MAKSQANPSPAAKAAFGKVQKGVDRLARSIADVEADLRRTERKIEADARGRIQRLRSDIRKQLSVMHNRRKEAERTLKRLSVAAGGSWHDISRGADVALADGRRVAASIVRRFRGALREA